MVGGTQAARRSLSAGADRFDGWIVDQPGYDRLKSAGEMGSLLFKVIRAAATPPYPWWRDCIDEIAITIRRCFVPLVISQAFFLIGAVALFLGTTVAALGTTDRIMGGATTGIIRDPGVWITCMVFCGVAGSAMTADLGARKIREELEAVGVLGVDVIKTMIVPRAMALTFAAPLIGAQSLFIGLATAYMSARLLYGISHGGALDAMDGFLIGADILHFLIKMLIVGLVTGIVACSKGMSVGGGAEGVGKAVNETVLITYMLMWLLSVLYNSGLLALFPELSALRG